MSNHHRAPTTPKARQQHRCVACWQMISAGEKHYHQTGYYEGKAYRNRYHVECWEQLSNGAEFEFTPGELDPPERLRAAQAQAKGA